MDQDQLITSESKKSINEGFEEEGKVADVEYTAPPMYGQKNNGPFKYTPEVSEQHSREINLRLEDVHNCKIEDPAGLKNGTPAKEPLGGGEMCLYYTMNILFSLCTACLSWCCGIYVINPMQAVIITVFGKILRVEMEPGVHWMAPLMVEKHYVNLAINTMQVQGSSVPDSNGSPMNVSTIVNYIITDPVAAVYNVENLYQFIHTQAYDVVRRICGKFRYLSNDPEQITLLHDGHHVAKHMKQLLQKRCEIAGVEILRMDFIDIAYHKEIATQLLQVQQAQARVDARKMIVAGSVEITHGAIYRLNECGLELSKDDVASLTTSLMVLTCSDGGQVHPVVII